MRKLRGPPSEETLKKKSLSMMGKKHTQETIQKLKDLDHSYKRKPNSKNPNTGHWRAKLILKRDKCLLYDKDNCSKRLEIHHIDKDPCNNSLDNIICVCTTHHRFLESGKITLENPQLPEFTISSGKRRYKKSKITI